MDANQRSEVNNQTNNLSNEKWTPGSKGKTADEGPLDHTYPQGLGVQQQGNQGLDTMGTQQTGAGPGAQPGGVGGRDPGASQSATPGGSMQTQMSGGSGPVQGITDSHQRQMEQKSAAYGKLELPVGERPRDSGVDVTEGHDMHRDVVRGTMASQNANQPDLQGGSLAPHHQGGSMQSGPMGSSNIASGGNTSGGGMHGPQSAPAGLNAGSATGNRQQTSSLYVSDNSTRNGGGMRGPLSGAQSTGADQDHPGQEAQRGNTQLGVAGSGAMANRIPSTDGVHQSTYASGGLPRSPGNTGADNAVVSTDRAGSQTGTGAADSGPGHLSNDAAGGLPRSPGYNNKLAGDSNMDDDTGFKRKR